jgi:hypothetical protein
VFPSLSTTSHRSAQAGLQAGSQAIPTKVIEDDHPFVVGRHDASALSGDKANDIGVRIAEAIKDLDDSASELCIEERSAIDAK